MERITNIRLFLWETKHTIVIDIQERQLIWYGLIKRLKNTQSTAKNRLDDLNANRDVENKFASKNLEGWKTMEAGNKINYK